MLYIEGLYLLVVVGLCISILTRTKYQAVSWGYWLGLYCVLVHSIAFCPYRLARITGELSSLFIK